MKGWPGWKWAHSISGKIFCNCLLMTAYFMIFCVKLASDLVLVWFTAFIFIALPLRSGSIGAWLPVADICIDVVT